MASAGTSGEATDRGLRLSEVAKAGSPNDKVKNHAVISYVAESETKVLGSNKL